MVRALGIEPERATRVHQNYWLKLAREGGQSTVHLKEKRLYLLPGMTVPPEFASLVADTNVRVISEQWFELLRLAMSIKKGTVTASVILRKLAAYPRQNSLSLALRKLGKLERTFFTLQRLQYPELRRRSHVGLNKGSSKMHSAALYSSTGSAKFATAPTKTSALTKT